MPSLAFHGPHLPSLRNHSHRAGLLAAQFLKAAILLAPQAPRVSPHIHDHRVIVGAFVSMLSHTNPSSPRLPATPVPQASLASIIHKQRRITSHLSHSFSDTRIDVKLKENICVYILKITLILNCGYSFLMLKLFFQAFIQKSTRSGNGKAGKLFSATSLVLGGETEAQKGKMGSTKLIQFY